MGRRKKEREGSWGQLQKSKRVPVTLGKWKADGIGNATWADTVKQFHTL